MEKPCRCHIYDQKDLCSGIGALKCIRGLIHQETANKAYQGFVEP